MGSAPDPRIQNDFVNLANELHSSYNDRARLCLTYDEPLSHLVLIFEILSLFFLKFISEFALFVLVITGSKSICRYMLERTSFWSLQFLSRVDSLNLQL